VLARPILDEDFLILAGTCIAFGSAGLFGIIEIGRWLAAVLARATDLCRSSTAAAHWGVSVTHEEMLVLVRRVIASVAESNRLSDYDCLRLEGQLTRLLDDPVLPGATREKVVSAQSWLAIFGNDGRCVEEGGRHQVRTWLLEDLEAVKRTIAWSIP
jgi:hypothetical protein